MAYLRITSKCNMSCAHCLYACRPGKGEHMTWDTFTQTVDALAGYEEFIAIGGGEPTMHPQFFAMLDYILEHRSEWSGKRHPSFCGVFLVTNGKNKRRAMKLIRKYEEHRDTFDQSLQAFDIELSHDQFHGPIDPEVYDWYARPYQPSGVSWGATRTRLRGNVDRDYYQIGAATKLPVKGHDVGECTSCSVEIDPDGSVWQCPHRDGEPIGHMSDYDAVGEFKDYLSDETGDCDVCWHEIDEEHRNNTPHRKEAMACL